MKQIHIENPCPFVPKEGNKTEKGFYCKSCRKNIIDFRNQDKEDIQRQLTPDTCGVFDSDQVTTGHLSLLKRILFRGLTVVSFLGFHISPVQSQTRESKYEEVYVKEEVRDLPDQKEENPIKAEPKKKKRRHRLFCIRRRHVRGKPISGCPSF